MSKRRKVHPEPSRHVLVSQVLDLLTLAHPTQLNQMVTALIEQCPTTGLDKLMQWSETKHLSSGAIRDSPWSRHVSWHMLDHIFLFLSIRELIRAEWVCKKWRSASMQRGLGWSRPISLIKGVILERQLRAPRKPTIARINTNRLLQDPLNALHDESLAVPFLTSFPELTELDLWGDGDSVWKAADMKHLAHFPQLTTFHWTGFPEMPSQLQYIGQYLSKLTSLWLDADAQGDRIPPQLYEQVASKLATLPLTWLHLEGFAHSESTADTGLGQILRSCPLKTLRLFGSHIFEALDGKSRVLEALSYCSSLTDLGIDNRFPSFASSASLTTLVLRCMKFKGDTNKIDPIKFPRLTSLKLSSCTVDGEDAVSNLGALALTRMCFSNTGFQCAPIYNIWPPSFGFHKVESCEVIYDVHGGPLSFSKISTIHLVVRLKELRRVLLLSRVGLSQIDMFNLPQKLQELTIGDLNAHQVRQLSRMENLAKTVVTLGVTSREALDLEHVRGFVQWSKLGALMLKTPTHVIWQPKIPGTVQQLLQTHFGPF